MLNERLALEQEKKKQERAKAAAEEEDEETLRYDVRPKQASINEDSGVFNIKKQTGINSAPSVFDKTAVFHTGTGSV